MKNPLRAPEVKAFIVKVIQEAGCKADEAEKMFMLEYRYWYEFLYKPGGNRHRAREMCRENALRLVKAWYSESRPSATFPEEKAQAEYFRSARRAARQSLIENYPISPGAEGGLRHLAALGKKIDERA